jgi:hypothetical protein
MAKKSTAEKLTSKGMQFGIAGELTFDEVFTVLPETFTPEEWQFLEWHHSTWVDHIDGTSYIGRPDNDPLTLPSNTRIIWFSA